MFRIKLGIYGARSLEKKIYDVVLCINEIECRLDKIIFIDEVRL